MGYSPTPWCVGQMEMERLTIGQGRDRGSSGKPMGVWRVALGQTLLLGAPGLSGFWAGFYSHRSPDPSRLPLSFLGQE